LACGDLAAGQVMPKNFTFYNPESHKRIVCAVESSGAVAIVAATGRDAQMVGSQYPFPLFEDGDLEVPNAYMRDVDGERLALRGGERIHLRIDSRRIPTRAEHLVATLPGDRPGRIVVTAHIDSRKGSPGALDNASGVAVLLALAELLEGRSGGFSVELVPFNGEDNYANPGEMLWVAENEGRFDDIVLGINIDDAGQVGTVNHVSFYGCPPEIEHAARTAMGAHSNTTDGPQWFQSDHAIFGIYGRPAMAIASSGIGEFMANYAHSERDTIELADPALLAEAARFIGDLVVALGRQK
jgi:aminopeptidase YwaD